MAHEIKLDVFTLQVKKQRKDEFVGFDEFYKKEGETNEISTESFKNFFTDYITSFDGKFWEQSITGKAINLSKQHVHFDTKERIIYGLVEGGTTGIGTKIKKKEDVSDENAFQVTTEMVSSIPYYFLLWLPKDSNKGLLIIQSIGNKSISETFKIHLRRFFNNSTKSLSFVTNELIPKETSEKMQKDGIINTIILRRMHLPSSKGAKLLGLKYAEGSPLTIEIKITGLSKIAAIKDKVLNTMKGKFPQLIDTTCIEDIGFDENYEILAKFEHDGKVAVGKLSERFKIAPSYYIKEGDINRNIYQHPEFESINKYCQSFLIALKKEIGYKKTK